MSMLVTLILLLATACLTPSISSVKSKVIIDSDGGADDALAIITALRLPSDVEVAAITTSCGNANATQAAINVLKTLRVLNRSEVRWVLNIWDFIFIVSFEHIWDFIFMVRFEHIWDDMVRWVLNIIYLRWDEFWTYLMKTYSYSSDWCKLISACAISWFKLV